MYGDWDKSMKSLVAGCPLAFAELALRHVDIETKGINVVSLLETEFQGYDVDADGLLLVETLEEEEILVHIEFQSTRDTNMPDQQLEYCFRAREKHGKKPIVSCVIYLRNVGNVPEPPHCWKFGEKKLMVFDYVVFDLSKMDSESIVALHEPAMLPLTILTKGGANRTIIEGVFNELREKGLRNLLPVTNLLASLVLKDNETELRWLERMYPKMIDKLLKDTPAYHWMTDAARKEGIGIGIEKGREEEREQSRESLRRIITDIMGERFPELVLRAQSQLIAVRRPELLDKLVKQISFAQSPDQIKHYLTDAFEESLRLTEEAQADSHK